MMGEITSCESCNGLFLPETLDENGWCKTCRGANEASCEDCDCDDCVRERARSDGTEAQASSGKRTREEEEQKEIESSAATQAEIWEI